MVGKRLGGFGTTLVLAGFIVVLSVALGLALASFGDRLPLVGGLFGGGGETRTTTSPVVVEGVRKLDRLATVRWTESVVVTKEDPGELGEALTGEKLVLVAAGEVEAGVDLAEIGPDDVRVSGDAVTVDLPEPVILGSSLDEEKTGLYDRDQGIFNLRPDDDLVEEARRDAEAEILTAARENGILDTAEANAEDSIRAFVTTLGFEEVGFE